jgi:hypothetical protein
MWLARVFLVLLFMLCLGTAQDTTTYIAHAIEPFPGPQVYKDLNSGTTLYVETDGRHVAGISADGKLLWNKDPLKEAHLDYYRTKKPQIIYVGPVSKSNPYTKEGSQEFAAITFNNSQFGLLRISNGEFQFLGQD